MSFQTTSGWLTTREVAAIHGLTQQRVKSMCADGRIRPAELDDRGHWRIDPLFSIDLNPKPNPTIGTKKRRPVEFEGAKFLTQGHWRTRVKAKIAPHKQKKGA